MKVFYLGSPWDLKPMTGTCAQGWNAPMGLVAPARAPHSGGRAWGGA